MEIKTGGAMIHCKADWTEMGEKPTSYFLSKEKQRHNSTVLDTINGKRVMQQNEIQI